ncbi:hypothetical protein EWM64_g4455 [Hericium alpestre]|uniref:MYND-type domain-containing protein n=1 Tax=Hericium alpestre TaxID=135208 RepID=A0A4Y9ZYE2_9AGAM|nr:hypothetical protein EWM64_g4455 [Hericium alpestre]
MNASCPLFRPRSIESRSESCSDESDDDAEARRFTLRLIKDTIPRYLVYRSVIVAVDAAMHALETPEDRKKIDKSPVADSWYQTKKLAHERLLIKWSAAKKAPKDNLKRCTGCGTTLYCSKECQVSGWKKSHKAECKLKKEELRVLQDDAIRKEDRLFHHHLAIRDARHNMPRLHSIAARDFPGVPKANLGMSIDYTVVPPTYSVFALDKHDLSKDIKPGTSRVTEARSESILEKAQMSGGKTTLIESKICVGEGCSIVMTLTAQSVWESAERWEEEEWRWHQNEGGDENTMPTSVDEIDLMMARNAIRGFLQAHGSRYTSVSIVSVVLTFGRQNLRRDGSDIC